MVPLRMRSDSAPPRVRPARRLPRQALARAHARAGRRRRRRRRRAALRGTPARRPPAPLRSPARDGGRAALLGGAQRALVRHRATSGSRSTWRITRSSTATSRGSSPQGNYGAGAVIVWDRGEWVPVGDPLEGLAKGKLLFELRGYKLRGTLDAGEDQEVGEGLAPHQGARRLGHQDPEALPAGVGALRPHGGRARRRRRSPARRIRARARSSSARRGVAVDVEGRQAHARRDGGRGLLPQAGWLFEPKLDGYRVLAARGKGEPRLLTRNGNDLLRPRSPRSPARWRRCPSTALRARRRGGRARRHRAAPASSGSRAGPG